MSSHIERLVFGSHSPAAPEFTAVDFTATQLAAAPADNTPLFGDLKYRLLLDERLAQRLQQGEADALAILFERHAPLLVGIARRILRSHDEAEDAVQQIFFDVFRSIQDFDPAKGAFKTWLLMFAFHRSFNCKRHLAATGFFSSDPLEEQTLQPESKQKQTDAPLHASILIQQILRDLEPRQRRTIELIYYEGLTAEEVATRTGETVRVVRHNLYRGMDRLRKGLSPKGSSTTKGGRQP